LPTGGGAVAGCGDNSYAHFIYSHESGCRTTAMNPNGCYGIGQACPASKLAYCGADYACQNAFFTAYAGKYGGWAGAYSFWVSHGWW
jgi:resuscitation-promoting factor RpfB